ncbi:hypothetical protein Y032_0036g3163 [Ancylostoma ceylanicum]|uniref:TIL domain-containing protein n=1 Tax=Ancylostoma ceylanicum TaxID=53326 RepID=A0A016UKU8_9BILA|nr:hypothetical protein Y032_0036g3163 [Ancylostoma ceylanicum]
MKFLVLVLALIFTYTTLINGQCGENEVGDGCYNGCEPTCRDPHVSCIAMCGPGGCKCKPGYLRNSERKCVPEDEC